MTQKFEEKKLDTIYVEGSLSSLISELQSAQRRYGKEGYGNLTIRSTRTCGHPFYCECSETPTLFGTRAVKGD